MLYKFKSKAAGDVIMLAASGDRVLRILGRDPAATGILEVAAMPAAMQAIEAAVAQDELERQQAQAEADTEGKSAPATRGRHTAPTSLATARDDQTLPRRRGGYRLGRLGCHLSSAQVICRSAVGPLQSVVRAVASHVS